MQYDLCNEAWIPIAGSSTRKSLRQIFSDLGPQRLSGNPVDKIVIFRFLLSLVHASTPLPDAAAWQALTTEKISKNVLDYLEKYHDRFDLYGDHPFLQFPKLAEIGGQPTALGSMMVNIAEGNKVVLTQWNQYKKISDAEKAILVLRSSCYACGGKRFDKNLILSNGVSKSTGPSGTLLGFRGFLHAYLLSDSLLDSLHLNLLTDEDMQEIGAFSVGKGTPFWENMPTGENDQRAKEYRNSYLGQLFPIDKFTLLKEEGIIKTTGITYQTDPQTMRDPALTVAGEEKKQHFLNASTAEHPWRELRSLLAFLEKDHSSQPYFLSMGLSKLRKSQTIRETITIWTGGMEVSANSGEQYLSGKNDYVESEFAFPISFLNVDGLGRLHDIMENLQQSAKKLYGCIVSYFKEMNSDSGTSQASKGVSLFWEQLEIRSQDILDLAFSDAQEEDIEQEKKTDFGILCRIYNEICPNETPRQMAAWVQCNPSFQNNKNRKEKK